MKKPANDINDLPPQRKEEIGRLEKNDRNRRKGLGCGELEEPTPSFIKAPCEIVYAGENNQYIVFGRDRSGPRFVSGSYDNGENLGPYGPKGYTKAGMIDIVLGRHSANSKSTVTINGVTRRFEVDPDFFKDAARIYVAQKTDVDSNFKIGSKEMRGSEGKSAIALKADAIRLISRERMKLVTGTDTKNSLGGRIRKVEGIDLIAGNDDRDIQPMIKGDNLVEAVQRLTNHVDKLNGIINAFLEYQMQFNEGVANHTHISPFFALPTTPSEVLMIQGRKTLLQMLNKIKPSILSNKINLANYQQNYLKDSGKKYICSRYNRTN